MKAVFFSNVIPCVTVAGKTDSTIGAGNVVKDGRVRGLSVPSEWAPPSPAIKKGAPENTRFHYFPLRNLPGRVAISSSFSWLLSSLLPYCPPPSWIGLAPHSAPLIHLCQPKKQDPGCNIFVRNPRGMLVASVDS
jgi:hypothetical protein